MADVPGGLVRCVIQLRACTDKLRICNEHLDVKLAQIEQDLPATSIPRLKRKLAALLDTTNFNAHALETMSDINESLSIEDAYQAGSKWINELELKQCAYEKEIQRRSAKFEDIVSQRNAGIHEEYKRMLKKIDEETEALKRSLQRKKSDLLSVNKRRYANITAARSRREDLKLQVSELTNNVQNLQNEYKQLTLAKRNSPSPTSTNVEETNMFEAFTEKILELQKEIIYLEDAKRSSTALTKANTSNKSSSDCEFELDFSRLQKQAKDVDEQIESQRIRLLSLIRILAPSSGIGSLMVRLFQQVLGEKSSKDVEPTNFRSIPIKDFLNSCGSVSEGEQAIQSLEQLQLICAYESSGLIVLAER